MTKDQLARLMDKAGLPASNGGALTLWPSDLMRFAEEAKAEFLERTGQYLTNDVTREAAIAGALAAEREACAQVCDHYAVALDGGDNHYLRSAKCRQAAAKIRARGML